jgi:alpha-tubulin suppressor-like RCC1 family protein
MWGRDGYGQLGGNIIKPLSSPSQTVCATKDWDTISCGGLHTAAVKIDGSLWTWGQNSFGQLGTNDRNHRSSPTLIGGYTWASVACGEFHTVAIKTDKSLWTWGYNKSGQLGTGDFLHRSSPIQISGTYKLPSDDNSNIWCGYEQTFVARDSDSAVFACGQNLENQLGVGDIGVRIKNLTRIDTTSLWLQEPNSYFIWISSSELHTCGITNNGAIWCWGSTRSGQSGTNMAYRKSGIYDGDFAIPTSPILINSNKEWKTVTAFSFITESDSGTGAV